MPDIMFSRRLDSNKIKKVINDLLPDDVVIEPGEVVRVPEARLKKFTRIFPQVDIYFPGDADMFTSDGDFETGEKRG